MEINNVCNLRFKIVLQNGAFLSMTISMDIGPFTIVLYYFHLIYGKNSKIIYLLSIYSTHSLSYENCEMRASIPRYCILHHPIWRQRRTNNSFHVIVSKKLTLRFTVWNQTTNIESTKRENGDGQNEVPLHRVADETGLRPMRNSATLNHHRTKSVRNLRHYKDSNITVKKYSTTR